jgi:hypothetical protein
VIAQTANESEKGGLRDFSRLSVHYLNLYNTQKKKKVDASREEEI